MDLIHPDISAVLFSAGQIADRVRELGAEIARDYAGQDLHLVAVLRGAVPFAADLARVIGADTTTTLTLDYLAVSSYALGVTSGGTARITKDIEDDIAGRNVLIVEDIIDSGVTLSSLVRLLRSRNPAGVEVCALLDKPAGRRAAVEARYVGFQLPDCFVVGYGMDYAQHYRSLPYIGVLRPEIYKATSATLRPPG